MPDIANFDFSIVLTAAGATVSAALIASVIEILKRIPALGPWVDAKHEPAVALLLSFVLVAYSYLLTTPTPDLASAGSAFIAFIGIAGLSTAVHDQVSSTTSSS